MWNQLPSCWRCKSKPNLRESPTAITTSENRANQEHHADYFTSSLVNRGLQKSSTDVILYPLSFSQLKHPTHTQHSPRQSPHHTTLPILQKHTISYLSWRAGKNDSQKWQEIQLFHQVFVFASFPWMIGGNGELSACCLLPAACCALARNGQLQNIAVMCCKWNY